jgi:putative hydrolase of the HAD superfamily
MNCFGLSSRPRGLLLDAGNTVVFLDMEAVARVVGRVGIEVEPVVLRGAEAWAKREYMAVMAAGGAHAEGWGLLMETLLGRAGVGPALLEPGVAALRREQSEFNLWRRVPLGLPDALDRARRGGIRLGLLSNAEGRIAALLERVGLAQFFEVIIDSALVGLAKPDPRIFALAARKLGLSAHELVYIGDLPDVDVLGARGAGMQAVLIDPYDHFPDFDQGARCASVAEVIEALLALD